MIRRFVTVFLLTITLLMNAIVPTMAFEQTTSQYDDVVVVYKNEIGKQRVLSMAIGMSEEFENFQAMKVTLPEAEIDSL